VDDAPLGERELAALREALRPAPRERVDDALSAVEWQVALEDVALMLIRVITPSALCFLDALVQVQRPGSDSPPGTEET
jgi:hypothetical protein